MRVCVLYCGTNANDPKLGDLAKRLAEGISANGHSVDVFDMNLEQGKILSFYDYIAVVTKGVSLFSKNIPDNVGKFLRAAGTISGKRCSCFISKGCLRKTRVLQGLMTLMESEGMYLKISDVLSNGAEAFAVGKHLHIESGLKG